MSALYIGDVGLSMQYISPSKLFIDTTAIATHNTETTNCHVAAFSTQICSGQRRCRNWYLCLLYNSFP